ncbi:MAG TPA: hypothetical protein VGM10_25285 [Actinocrinis sp.]
MTTRVPVTRRGIDMTGLTAGPAQAWGAVRIVPLIRDEPITDLRLHTRLYDPDDLSIVRTGSRTAYIAYVPHAFVATWADDGTPAAAYGTQLLDPDARAAPACIDLRFRRRMARREDKQRLRFLPLHLALEGYLSLQFGGPPIAWADWTEQAVVNGLSPRAEAAYSGASVPGLDDALRIFEIHPGQCGAALYIADALAAAFVVPHPDDYRAMHPTLLRDLYGEQLYHYAYLYPAVPDFRARLDEGRVGTVADLRAELARSRREWAGFHDLMAAGLLGEQGLATTAVHRMGRFTLSRFLPPFDPDAENHIGETITADDGRLAYLKTFRLSAAQVRRGFLLWQLGQHDWDLDDTATHMKTTRRGLVQRLNSAGFGYLLRP